MSPKRKIEITIETDEVFIVRNAADAERAWCSQCGKWTRLVAPERVAFALNISLHTLRNRAESGEIHLMPTANGPTRLCLNSLLSSTATNQADESAISHLSRLEKDHE